ncbi:MULTISPECIES: hypothetical protein [Romboutsia]|uniref:DUF948 domain-containing protein n=1 Tax=Romboutsia hominis TaxID=1507512 RepID=A0A2P2BVF5_9FIRM|nr:MULTISPECIES: hypothetical protein [Romboutsia]MCH1958853.1 DUF948 domain-containing protein [Romboutsia hominis]MCH1967981.1 DUF948 domain-containing protein [Romboutsia hominis]MDB8790814.1 DUF948 domain-containing protein [Romboutsia sp. 1001216sp1]MDB8794040.1 DUF948 domain-containing protein [Romboutsia sp. 1001216sp1]MDB8796967.1 DUF948 domain-containing protein [Romboutsia sp. 1001216sp1]
MDAMGWQIGAVLFGVSALIIAIYIGRLLNETTKVVGKVYKIVDYNERHIHETIENVAAISKNTEEITDLVGKVAGIAKIFKFIKR